MGIGEIIVAILDLFGMATHKPEATHRITPPKAPPDAPRDYSGKGWDRPGSSAEHPPQAEEPQ